MLFRSHFCVFCLLWSLVQGAGRLRQISLWSLTMIISISETGKRNLIHFLELPYQHTQFVWLKYNRDVLSHSSGSWKSRLKVQQGWALLRAQASPISRGFEEKPLFGLFKFLEATSIPWLAVPLPSSKPATLGAIEPKWDSESSL